LHDEHLQEAAGIQAPKYNQTKHNKIDNIGVRNHGGFPEPLRFDADSHQVSVSSI